MINPILFARYQIALLQLEEFDLRRFLATAVKTWIYPPVKLRKPITPTPKLILVTGMATAIAILVSYYLPEVWSGQVNLVMTGFLVLAGFYLFFGYLAVATVILIPLDVTVKTLIIKQAISKTRAQPDLKVIGVAGSYGKTTMKEMLTAVLKQQFEVLATPANINTPLGIARLVLKSLTPETQIFVMEMGEYRPGDLAGICRIARPDISIITGINEAHLERMGNMENTIATIFESVTAAEPDSVVVLNMSDPLVRDNYQKFCHGKEVIMYDQEQMVKDEYTIRNSKIEKNGLHQTVDVYQGKKKIATLALPILGAYAAGDCMACIKIGRKLGMSWEEIEAGLSNVKPALHRLQPLYNQTADILVIDDTYNANPQGVREAINLLARFTNRRKVYVTPGIVETGEKAPEIHQKLGRRLAEVADLVVLVENSVTKWIAKGLGDSGFPNERILWYASGNDVSSRVSDFVKPGDVVLFQNDWPDNYI